MQKNKSDATLMLGIEIAGIETVSVILNAVGINHSAFYEIFVLRLNLLPQGRNDSLSDRFHY